MREGVCDSGGIAGPGSAASPQRLQEPLIKKYTLNHIRDPAII